VWVISCVGAASLAQSISGFGFALLAVPLMQLVVEPRDAVVITTFIGALSTTTQAVLDRQHVDRSMMKRLVAASYLGMPFGLLVFLYVSDTGLRIGLGVVVIAAAFSLLRGFSLRPSRVMDWTFGFLSGVLSTSTSTNGPPLVFLMQARNYAPQDFRSTINTVFSFANIGAIAFFVSSGMVTKESVIAALASIPALFVALKIGYWLRPKVSAELFRKLVITLLFLSGFSVGLKALL
jgi:uncharacterized membrane protein YfcA